MKGPWYVTNDARRRAAWGEPCATRATAGSVIIDGRRFACDPDAVPAFEAWEKVRAAFGYRLTGNDTGIYSCRHMRHDPNLPMSSHSWGRALDVNWLENPAGSKLITDIPDAMIDALLAIRTNSGARVFQWGADWDWDNDTTDHTYVDAMHWENVTHPLDMATGIDPNTVLEVDEMTIRVTSPLTTGKAVEKAQQGLLAWNPSALPRWGADGEFGGEAAEWTRAFQEDHGLPVTGEVDGITFGLLLSYIPTVPAPANRKVRLIFEGVVSDD